MSSLSAFKALVSVAALGLGVGTMAMLVSLQRDPFKFTSLDPRELPAPEVEVRAVATPVVIELEPLAAFAEPEPAATPDKSKRLTRRLAPAAMIAPQPVKKQAPPKPEPASAAADPGQDRVIPAPCQHGEYRMLDEHRGVRLMCPGQL